MKKFFFRLGIFLVVASVIGAVVYICYHVLLANKIVGIILSVFCLGITIGIISAEEGDETIDNE